MHSIRKSNLVNSITYWRGPFLKTIFLAEKNLSYIGSKEAYK